MSRRPCIVIIGGGFSGAAAAIHLSRLSPEPLDLRIVEPRATLGRGIAHSQHDPDLRLNGPDSIHAPYPQSPNGFAEWMRESGELAADPDAMAANGLVFPRRGAFGRYMSFELGKHARSNISDSTIQHIQQHAVSAIPRAIGVDVELGDGRTLCADWCILALGWNEVGVPRELSGVTDHSQWFGDPWCTNHFDSIDPNASVLLVGSGLSASDTFAALSARGHRGRVLSLSRRGLRPGSQNPYRSNRSIWERVYEAAPPVMRDLRPDASPLEATRLLRQRISEIDAATSSWHVPFDEFRDAARLIWEGWSAKKQRQYIRHLKRWYDTFRFRNPPQTEIIVRVGEESGRLTFMAGRLRSARADSGMFNVEFDARENGDRLAVQVHAIINCTGPQPRPSTSKNPLWRTLLARGVVKDAHCGVGIEVDSKGRVLPEHGETHKRLFAIGPPTIGRFAEVTAVPYIVRGILEVVEHIALSGNGRHRKLGSED